MPIRPSQRWFYPIDWAELSFAIRFDRAGGRCERCGRPHGETVWHMSRERVAGRQGLWWDEHHRDNRRRTGGAWRCERGRVVPAAVLPPPAALAGRHVEPLLWPGPVPVRWPRRTRVVLACCHLDHDPTNNDAANLAALCQHCHLEHDRLDNLRRRRRGHRERRAGAMPALFG